jgi:hypothetical protein
MSTNQENLPKKHAGGRPSKYTPELAALICKRVATNHIGTAKLCKIHDDLPDDTTIYEWRYERPEFSRMYAEAKIKQSELLAERLIDLAEEKAYYIDAEGNERVDGGFIQSQRLQVDTTKWIAAKLLPKVYGDKQQTDITVKHEDDLKSLAK